jgi:hypothetical protein
MKQPDTAEEGVVRLNLKAVHPVRGQLYYDGCPVPNALVTFYLLSAADKKGVRMADGRTAADGSFTLSTYTANDGAPAGEYAVAISAWQPIGGDAAKATPLPLPARFRCPATSGVRVQVRAGANSIPLDLK